jgi:hypothetical protein
MKRKFTFIAFLISFFSVACFAQGGKKGMQQMKQELKDSLQLTDTQADSVEAIMTEFQPQIKGIMKDQSLSKDQKKQKIKPVKKQMVARLHTILSDEQIDKLERMQKDLRKGGGGSKKGENPEPGEDTSQGSGVSES